MNILDWLLLLTFVAGLVPACVFTGLYAVRSAWASTEVGRAIMTLMFVITTTYLSGVLTLIFPDFFRAEPGVILRIAVRAACAAALVRMCIVLVKTQRTQHRPREWADN